MTEPETEIDTLDRLEAALRIIASHGGGTAGALQAERVEVAAGLDRLIAQLRDALALVEQAEH